MYLFVKKILSVNSIPCGTYIFFEVGGKQKTAQYFKIWLVPY